MNALNAINDSARSVIREVAVKHPDDLIPTWKPTTPIQFYRAVQANIIGLFETIDLDPTSYQNRCYLLEGDQGWTVEGFYRGLVPQWLTTKIQTLYETSQPVARQVAFSSCKTFAKTAHEQIWKPRCAAVAEWGSTNNITQHQKRTHARLDDVEDKE
ncbi:hypothetical protein BGZ50_009656, partial [Haplosporangium sp. Z 11]